MTIISRGSQAHKETSKCKRHFEAKTETFRGVLGFGKCEM